MTEQTSKSAAQDTTGRGTGSGTAQTFARIANRTSALAGSYRTFLLMAGIVVVWAASGPLFDFSSSWQLVINTSTTIVTFLMVFLIQNTQNRDSMAVHMKLDEIIRAIDAADDDLIRAEDETDDELAELKRSYQLLSRQQHSLKQAIAARLGERDPGEESGNP